MILFDIQSDQRAGVDSLVRSAGLPVVESVPVVTVKYTSIKGLTAEMVAGDTVNGGRRRGRRDTGDSTGRPGVWIYGREQRGAGRDLVVATGKAVAGGAGG